MTSGQPGKAAGRRTRTRRASSRPPAIPSRAARASGAVHAPAAITTASRVETPAVAAEHGRDPVAGAVEAGRLRRHEAAHRTRAPCAETPASAPARRTSPRPSSPSEPSARPSTASHGKRAARASGDSRATSAPPRAAPHGWRAAPVPAVAGKEEVARLRSPSAGASPSTASSSRAAEERDAPLRQRDVDRVRELLTDRARRERARRSRIARIALEHGDRHGRGRAPGSKRWPRPSRRRR